MDGDQECVCRRNPFLEQPRVSKKKKKRKKERQRNAMLTGTKKENTC